MTALLKRHQDDGRMHILCRIKAQSIAGRSAECWLNTQPQVYKNGRQLSVALKDNQAGLPLLNRSDLQGLRCALAAAGAGIFNWHDDVPDTVGNGPPPKLSATFRAARRSPAPEAGTAATADPLDDQRLAELYADYAAHTPDAQYSHATCIYTDGSKDGASLTGGVYVEGGPSRAFALQGHDPELNTVLRAELAAISSGVELLETTVPAGYPQRTAYVLTDSLTSIFLISKGLHNPEGLRSHKHRHLVFRIVQQLLASPHNLRVVKVRAHTGVMGNEAADRLAREAQQGLSTSLPFEALGSSGRGLH
jgi:ribonuclease HI